MSKMERKIDMMYSRSLKQVIETTSKSVLLLGPRQTGKSTLIGQLEPDLKINLARESVYLQYASNPDLLERILNQICPKTVFIDEVQRIPSLLNTIQAILDENPGKFKFYLTGSSARKLKRGNANLLPGRIVAFHFHPLTIEELNYQFDLEDCLAFGTLPGVFVEKNTRSKKQILGTYGATYLKEEIREEALTKNIEGFSRFLFVAAAKNGEFMDYAKLGAQAAITQKTASRFFEILEDTLIVYRLEAYKKTSMRRLIKHPKFYFFDTGVLNSLLGNYQVTADRKGFLFETFVIDQVRSLFMSKGIDVRLSTFRTDAGAEVDLIIESDGKTMAVEIKAGKNVSPADLRGFKSFEEVAGFQCQKMVIYLGDFPQRINDVEILPLIPAFQRLSAEWG